MSLRRIPYLPKFIVKVLGYWLLGLLPFHANGQPQSIGKLLGYERKTLGVYSYSGLGLLEQIYTTLNEICKVFAFQHILGKHGQVQ